MKTMGSRITLSGKSASVLANGMLFSVVAHKETSLIRSTSKEYHGSSPRSAWSDRRLSLRIAYIDRRPLHGPALYMEALRWALDMLGPSLEFPFGLMLLQMEINQGHVGAVSPSRASEGKSGEARLPPGSP
eukprot:jgi/Mesen1/5778/ME000293S04935